MVSVFLNLVLDSVLEMQEFLLELFQWFVYVFGISFYYSF